MTSVESTCASPGGVAGGSRGSGKILHFPDLASGTEADQPFGRDALLAMALELAEHAPSWPSMANPVFGSPLIRRRWELVPASIDVEAWFIAWPPGGSMELHDHGGSVGAVVVSCGELIEARSVPQPRGGVYLRTTTVSVGGSIGFAEQDVHGITNAAEVPAISVHVYSPALTSLRYHRQTQRPLRGQHACCCARDDSKLADPMPGL